MISYGWCITEERKTVDHKFKTICEIYMHGFPSYHVSADLPHPPLTQRKKCDYGGGRGYDHFKITPSWWWTWKRHGVVITGDGLITHHSTIHHLRGGDSYLEGDILQHAPFQMESPWAAAEDSLEKTLHTQADIQILISMGRTILKGSTQCTTQFFLEGMVAFLTCTCSRSLWKGCHMHQESNLHAWK